MPLGENQRGNGSNASTSNGSNASAAAMLLDENQTAVAIALGSSSVAPALRLDKNQTNQTAVATANDSKSAPTARLRTSLAQRSNTAAYEFQGNNTSVEGAQDGKTEDWWDELNAAVPRSCVLAVLTLTRPLLQ